MTSPETSEAEVLQYLREQAKGYFDGIMWRRSDKAVATLALVERLTAAAQVRAQVGQENMIMGTLGTIANMPDEDNEWDGTDKFRVAREMARTVLAHTEPAAALGIRKGE